MTRLLPAMLCLLLCANSSFAQVHQQLIEFKNGPVTLRGVLLTPKQPRTEATLIMVHGSGPATRDSFGGLDDCLARAGIPVLVYDKRGVQDSTGDWKRASIDDLASDALAAVAFLKARGVRKIGLWGGSQGGWIVPLAAATSDDVAFIITVSAAGVSPAQQELFRQELQWKAAGLSELQITQLRDAWKCFYHYAASGRGAKDLDAAIAPLEAVKLLDDRRPLKSTELPDDALVRYLGYSFDPLPHWKRVHCPVLAIWGDQDKFVPVTRSAQLIQEALGAAGNANCTFKIYPGAAHGLTVSDKQIRRPDGTSQLDWAPSYLETTVDWISQLEKR